MGKNRIYKFVFLFACAVILLISFDSCRGNPPAGKKIENVKTNNVKIKDKKVKDNMDKLGEIYQLSDLQEGQSVSLTSPLKKGKMSLEEALWGRKSVRIFSVDKLDPDQIGQLLWAAQGINRLGSRFKACPSAGATYPLTAYAVTADGIFEYIPEGHIIRKIADGDWRKSLSQAALGQGWVASAPLSIVITAVYGRTTGRYGDRGVMYVHMEAGHAAQNIHLQAVALGLGSVPVGAFSDDKVARVMRCDRDEVPLYIIPVGYPL